MAPTIVLHGGPGSEAAQLLVSAAPVLQDEARAALHDACFDLAVEAARPFAHLFAATLDEEPVGFLVGWEVADELHVLSVVVASRARRRGVGRALVASALGVAETLGTRVVLLEVRRGNVGAIRLYREAGFVAVGVRPRYYANGDDAVEMAFARDAAVLRAFDRVEDDAL